MKKRLKKLAKICLLLFALLLVAAASLWIYFAYEDAQHAQFLRTGRSINEFLTSYGRALRAGFQQYDSAPLAPFYAVDFLSPGRGDWQLARDADQGEVTVWRLQAAGKQDQTRNEVLREWTGYLTNLTAVEDIKCKIDMIENAEPDKRAVLTVKFILDGRDRAGLAFQDRFFFRWHLVGAKTENGDAGWQIVRDELVEGVRVAGSRTGFQELPPASIGIDYKHERDPHLDPTRNAMRFEVMEHAGSGVTVVDVDNDSRPDLFFADGKHSRLYRNVTETPGQPRFIDVTRAAGLEGIGQANAGIFADVDNDGFKDLFIVRYGAPCLFFHNNGNGTFTECTKAMGLDLVAPCMSACFLDFDRDGFVDLYVGVYGDAFHEIPRLPFFAQNGGKNRLYRNVDGKHFVDVTQASGTGDTGWTLAVAAGDLDEDGYPELVVVNDFGKKTLYHNNRDGTFTEVTKQAGVVDISGGMGVALGDYDGDGRLDIYFSNINSNQRWFGESMTALYYLRNVARTSWAYQDFAEYRKLYDLLGDSWQELGKKSGRGNSLFRNRGDGTFEDRVDSHTNRAGWGWGVAFLDLGNTGDLSIFAANGWISNVRKDDL